MRARTFSVDVHVYFSVLGLISLPLFLIVSSPSLHHQCAPALPLHLFLFSPQQQVKNL